LPYFDSHKQQQKKKENRVARTLVGYWGSGIVNAANNCSRMKDMAHRVENSLLHVSLE